MAVKQRAIALEDKEERRHVLLDAAEALFLEHPDRMASVAEVAEAAGLAKGTVYLYFPSKEEMLLALHERHDGGLLRRAHEAARPAAGPASTTSGPRRATTSCAGPATCPSPAAASASWTATSPRKRRSPSRCAWGRRWRRPAPASSGTSRRCDAGGGVTLLQHSYGLIVGLWQLMHPIERFGTAMERAELAMFKRDYEREVEQALRALWAGTMGEAPARARAEEIPMTRALPFAAIAALLLPACGRRPEGRGPRAPRAHRDGGAGRLRHARRLFRRAARAGRDRPRVPPRRQARRAARGCRRARAQGPAARAPRPRGREARRASRARAGRLGGGRPRARQGRARPGGRPPREEVHQPVRLRRAPGRLHRRARPARSRRARRPPSPPTRSPTRRSPPTPTGSWSRWRPSPGRSWPRGSPCCASRATARSTWS